MKLRHRAKIESNTSAQGAENPSFTLFKDDIPADFIPVSGGEKFRGFQIDATVNWLVRIRFLAGLLPKMRLTKFNSGEVMDIKWIKEIKGRRKFMMVACTELTTRG